MKKMMSFALALSMSIGLLAGCGNDAVSPATQQAPEPRQATELAQLNIQLPAKVQENMPGEVTQAFSTALKAKLFEQGYSVENINMSIGTSDSATGEALASGAVDLTFLPASQYFSYSDTIDVILSATQSKLSADGVIARNWNGVDNAPTATEEQVPYGRTLICATGSEYGKQLAAKVNGGKTLSFDELNAAGWAVLKTTTSSDFIYPDLWLSVNYGTTTADLSDVIALDGYSALFTLAAQQKIDIIVISADKRMDYAASWELGSSNMDMTGKMGLGQQGSIFDTLNVIGVSEPIYGDVIAITKANTAVYNDAFIAAIQTAMTAMSETEEGKNLYTLCGYAGFTTSGAGNYENISQLALTGDTN